MLIHKYSPLYVPTAERSLVAREMMTSFSMSVSNVTVTTNEPSPSQTEEELLSETLAVYI